MIPGQPAPNPAGQMEEHLRAVRGYSHEASLPGIGIEQQTVRAQLAIANGLAAVAYAALLLPGDLAADLGPVVRELGDAISDR